MVIMLDSQARIVGAPQRIGAAIGQAGDAEHAVSFQFRVHWSTVFVALESAKEASMLALDDAPRIEARSSDNTVIEVSPSCAAGKVVLDSHANSPDPAAAAPWEMVIPK